MADRSAHGVFRRAGDGCHPVRLASDRLGDRDRRGASSGDRNGDAGLGLSQRRFVRAYPPSRRHFARRGRDACMDRPQCRFAHRRDRTGRAATPGYASRDRCRTQPSDGRTDDSHCQSRRRAHPLGVGRSNPRHRCRISASLCVATDQFQCGA